MSEIFRDRTEGAMARRQDLLRKRRDEFVTMPHAIRRVIVARAARAAAAFAIIVAGIAMVTIAMVPSLAAYIARGLPGINPAVISTFVGAGWVLGLVAFAISRGRAEHRFAVEMSSFVLPGKDLDHDIERLSHEHPDEMARQMAHRLEVRSAALPVAAAGFLLPATLVYIAHGIYAAGWPSTADYELNLSHLGPTLLVAAIAGLFTAILMTRPAMRSPKVTPIAATIAVLSGALAGLCLWQREMLPCWIASVVCVLTGTIALVGSRLSRERAFIEANDPAAGSELFTFKGFVAAMKSGAIAARRRVSTPMAVGAVAFGTLLVCAGGPISTGPRRAAATVTQRGQVRQVQPAANMFSKYEVTPTHDGRLRIAVTFVGTKPVEIVEGFSGMTFLPHNWRARVTISLESHDMPGLVQVTPFPGNDVVAPLHFGDDSVEHRFTTAVCDDRDQPLGLRLVPEETWPTGTYRATFLVEPILELAPCVK